MLAKAANGSATALVRPSADCSLECQVRHWPQHKTNCKPKGSAECSCNLQPLLHDSKHGLQSSALLISSH